MKLTYRNSRYEAQTRYDEMTSDGKMFARELLKRHSFRWDPNVRVWWTDKAETAARFIDVADDAARPHLEPVAVVQREALQASAATTADISVPCPEGLAYRPFQLAGIAYMAKRKSSLLGDEMGVGKTVQACGLINLIDSIKSVLVVCPANAKNVWDSHLRRWLVRQFTIGVAYGNDLPDTQIVIINKDILHRHEDALRARHWDLMLVDEVHYFRNLTARMTRSVFGYVPKRNEIAKAKKDGKPEPKPVEPIPADMRVYLTGTPLVNRPKEMWPILHSLDPQTWNNEWGFYKRYCAAHQEKIYKKGCHGIVQYVWNITGSSHEDELQHRLRETIMIRRLKTEVLKELPPKVRQVITLEPTPEQKKAILRERDAFSRYEEDIQAAEAICDLEQASDNQEAYVQAILKVRRMYAATFEELAKFRHDTGLAKVPSVVEFVKDMLDNQGIQKVGVWAHHQDVIAAYAEALKEYGVRSIVGGDSDKHRRKAEEDFQNDPSVRVFIGSIQAAGVAITLTAGNVAVFGELDFVPGNMKQAEDRHHRFGSEVHESINIYQLVLDGSLDQMMCQLLEEKTAVANAILDDDLTLHLSKDEPKQRKVTVRQFTEDERYAIRESLRILSGLDSDHCRERNDVGWNGVDSYIGHRLAAVEDLSDKQCALSKRILLKYHNQIPLPLYMTIYGKPYSKKDAA